MKDLKESCEKLMYQETLFTLTKNCRALQSLRKKNQLYEEQKEQKKTVFD